LWDALLGPLVHHIQHEIITQFTTQDNNLRDVGFLITTLKNQPTKRRNEEKKEEEERMVDERVKTPSHVFIFIALALIFRSSPILFTSSEEMLPHEITQSTYLEEEEEVDEILDQTKLLMKQTPMTTFKSLWSNQVLFSPNSYQQNNGGGGEMRRRSLLELDVFPIFPKDLIPSTGQKRKFIILCTSPPPPSHSFNPSSTEQSGDIKDLFSSLPHLTFIWINLKKSDQYSSLLSGSLSFQFYFSDSDIYFLFCR